MESSWVQTLSALLTPMIAVVATYVAWQQWNTNKLNSKLDRYDRRLKVYVQTRDLIAKVMRSADADLEDLFEFWREVSEADFLFGEDIPAYLTELFENGVDLQHANKAYEANRVVPQAHYDSAANTAKMHDLSVWFSNQHKVAKAKFMPYLHVGSH